MIAGGVCLGLLVFLLWKEGRRADRSHLMARVVATVLAVAALAGLVLPLTYHRAVTRTVAGKEGIYLTEGYDPESLRLFLSGHPEIHELWGTGGRAAPDGLVWPVSRLHVFGYGLTGAQWAALRPPALVFHPGRRVRGVVAVDWQRRLFTGERLQVQGHWQGQPVKLLLMGLGTVLDSANADGDFSLGTVPAQTGRAVYRLVAMTGRDTMEQEEIPVESGYGQPLKILILAATPDFENTFLAGWLGKNRQKVAIRTTVCRYCAQSSFVNMMPRSLDRLSSSLLGGFDIVIADSSALPAAGDAELPILRRQVEEKGLGLIVKLDSAYFRKKPGMRTFAIDSLSRIMVGGSLYGTGKVVYTTLNTTYVRMMAGQSASYAAYWSSLLRRVGPGTGVMDDWRLMPAEPRVGEPAEVVLQMGTAGQPQGLAGGITGGPVSVYLAQDEVLSFDWRGRYWPEWAGWQALQTLAGDTTWAYAWPRGAWSSLYREQRRRETMGYRADESRVSGGGVGDSGGAGDSEKFCRYPSTGFIAFFC